MTKRLIAATALSVYVLVGPPAGVDSARFGPTPLGSIALAQEPIRYIPIQVDPDEMRGTVATTIALPPLPSVPNLPAPPAGQPTIPATPVLPARNDALGALTAQPTGSAATELPGVEVRASVATVPDKTAAKSATGAKMAQEKPAADKPSLDKTPAEKPADRPAAGKPTYRPPIAAPRPASITATPAAASPATGAPTSLAADAAPSVISIEVNRGQVVRLPRPAATVFIANPEIADVQVKSANLVYVFAKKGGDTTLIAADDQDKLLVEARVVVTANIERLREGIRQLAPRRSIEISSVGSQFVLDGLVSSPAESEDIRRMASAIVGDERQVINRLKISAPVQVNLRVRVAEMTKEITKQLGFNWALARDILSTTSELAARLTVVNPNAANIANKFQVTGRNGAFDVNTIIDAMDQENLVKILAQPNLTAISGQTASFLVGGEFPILVPQTLNLVTVEYKKFGVSLAFQPTVLTDNRINLHVRPEVSELSDQGSVTLNGFTIPALSTRRAETTIELASGQSFAIAGLIRNDVTHQITKWPGLADIPILGALFRSDSFLRRETELVIIVTPYVVEPVSNPQQVAAPTDGFRPPHDLDRIFLGAQWRRDPTPGSTEALTGRRPRLAGPAGFQLE